MAGIVAVAATDKGVVYEGAFGVREIGKSGPMTLDTVVWLASMTKAVTATAAMQLVETGKLSLDRPAAETVPELGATKVLEGFGADGQPRLRSPRRSITLRDLLTHTSGFSYEMFSETLARHQALTNTPPVRSCKKIALSAPLVFDPGERWEYGIGIDWVGRMVEAASGQRLDRYFEQHIFAPLGMHDTSFKISASQRARLARVHQRGADGALKPIAFEIEQDPEFHMGGGGLYGTAPDYLRFTRMIVDDGRAGSAQILRSETIAEMSRNHIGALDVPVMKAAAPAVTNDVEWFPGMTKKWGLSFLINTQAAPTGRAPGSLAWAGLANTYYWIDRTRRVTGVFVSQTLPFYDATAVELFTTFETEVYRSL